MTNNLKNHRGLARGFFVGVDPVRSQTTLGRWRRKIIHFWRRGGKT